MSNLTDEEFKRLNDCRSEKDWADATKAVRDARGGAYADDWYARMLATGLMDKIVGRFGQAGFAVTSFGTSQEMADAMAGKPVPNAKTEVLGLPDHDYDGRTILMEPVRARLRSIGHARPDLPREVAQICGMYADHMGNADRLVEMGVCMSFVLFTHDLHRGVNGYTRERMRNPLEGLPGFLFQFVLLDVRDNVLASVLPDGMREKVAEKFAEMDKLGAETSAASKRAAESLEVTLLADELSGDAPKTGG